MKAKEAASEASRTGRLSLGWCGKGCSLSTREKNPHFNRGVLGGRGGGGGKGIEEKIAAANPKGHPLIHSPRLEGALPQNNFYLGRGLDCSRRSQRTDGSWNSRLQLGPGSPSLRSVTGSHAPSFQPERLQQIIYD